MSSTGFQTNLAPTCTRLHIFLEMKLAVKCRGDQGVILSVLTADYSASITLQTNSNVLSVRGETNIVSMEFTYHYCGAEYSAQAVAE